MKQSFVLLAVVAGGVTAQNLGSCAQLCVNNMNLIANSEFGCAAGDTACFCRESNWAYGVRDCSRQACSAEESAQAVSYAAGLCQVVGSASASGTPAAVPILTSALASATDATGTASASAASSASSALASATGAIGSAASSATEAAGSAASSATEAAGSAASSAASNVPSQGAAPQITGAPVVAGLAAAAWFFI